MKKILKYPLTILFFAFILIAFVFDIAKPDKEFSEFENKKLKQKPTFTWDGLVSNKYTQNYEKYINDQFVGRDNWINLKSMAEMGLGKIENNGVVYGKDKYMFDKLNTPDMERLNKNMEYFKQFTEKYPDENITVGIIPNSYEVLTDKVPFGLNNIDQTKYTNELFSRLNGNNLRKIYFLETLKPHKDEYIYYKTDHHWTTLGAYYAYSEYMHSMSMEPVSLDEIKDFAMNVEDFYGTYFNKSKLISAESDTITVYNKIPVDSVEINMQKKNGLYDMKKFNTRDKYGAFLYGNNGQTVIKSSVNKYHKEGKTSKILVIKDSYANSFVPFLMYNFDEIHVVDLRHFAPNMSDYLKENNFDEILLMYNFKNFSEDTNIPKLRY